MMAIAVGPMIGGYECDFVATVPESLSCPICLLPFRDPHLLDCCGAKYCAECIGRVKKSSQPCPICKQQKFNSLLDKNDQRKVLALVVRCSKSNEGCQWKGELRRLNSHEKDECGWILVACRYDCGGRIFRRQLAEHERECLQRSELKIMIKEMEERHLEEMNMIDGKVKQLEQSVERRIREQDTRFHKMIEEAKQEARVQTVKMRQLEKSMEKKDETRKKSQKEFDKGHAAVIKQLEESIARIKDEYFTKMSDEIKKELKREMELKEQALMKQLEQSVEARMEEIITQMKAGLTVTPEILIMTECSKHMEADDTWYSAPFYTTPGGYRLCIGARIIKKYMHMYSGGNRLYVSVHSVSGENDNILVWPLRGTITIHLFSDDEQDCCEKTLHIRGIKPTKALGERGPVIAGEALLTTIRELKDDSLTFRVTKLAVGLRR